MPRWWDLLSSHATFVTDCRRRYGSIVREALGNPTMDIGPLDHMLELRKRLECKPFSWYMKEVSASLVHAAVVEVVDT
jgi:hypothetical protein